MSAPLVNKLGVTVGYSTVFGQRPQLAELHSLISPLRRQDVILSLAWILAITKGWRSVRDNREERKVRPHFLPTIDSQLPSGDDWFVFSRFTLLWLMKQACMACPVEGLRVDSAPTRERLGVACLMANDLVTSVRTLQGSLDLAANMMASIDCYSFDEHDRDIVRSRYLLREIAPRSKRQTVRQLPSRIESLVGFQIEEYCDLAFGACMKNMAADVGDIAYITPALKADNFQPTSIDPLRAELFLRTISATEDEFFQELSQKATHELDLTVFRNRPLLRMADTYAVLDVGLALDKAGRSLFWTALKSAEAAKERMGMLGNWGYLFEDYTNEILNGVGHPSRAVIANPCFHDGT